MTVETNDPRESRSKVGPQTRLRGPTGGPRGEFLRRRSGGIVMKNADSNQPGRYCSRCGYHSTGLTLDGGTGARFENAARNAVWRSTGVINFRRRFFLVGSSSLGPGFLRGLGRSPGVEAWPAVVASIVVAGLRSADLLSLAFRPIDGCLF